MNISLLKKLEELVISEEINFFRPYANWYIVGIFQENELKVKKELYFWRDSIKYLQDSFEDLSLEEVELRLKSLGLNYIIESIPRRVSIFGYFKEDLLLKGWEIMKSSQISEVKKSITQILKKNIKEVENFRASLIPKERINLEDLTLKFLGGASQVGRSCCILQSNLEKVMIDCGLKPGLDCKPYLDRVNLSEISTLYLTHAHYDHIGGVPYMVKNGFKGAIYCSKSTFLRFYKTCLEYLSLSSDPVYNQQDLENSIKHFLCIDEWGLPPYIQKSLKVNFQPSGHMSGALMFEFEIYHKNGTKKLLHTGDFRGRNSRFYEGPTLKNYNFLICEGTYGGTGKTQNSKEKELSELVEVIVEIFKKGGKVIIPTLQNRALEVYHELVRVIKDKKLNQLIERIRLTPGIIKSISLDYDTLEDWNPEFSKDLIGKRDLKTYVPLQKEALNWDGPLIIITAPGMLEGGSSLELVKLAGPIPENAIIFTNFLPEGTLGRAVLDNSSSVSIKESYGTFKTYNFKALIKQVGSFSAHATESEIINFLNLVIPRGTVYLNHGNRSGLKYLYSKIKTNERYCYVPFNLESYRLI